jgi:hypothetical protein
LVLVAASLLGAPLLAQDGNTGAASDAPPPKAPEYVSKDDLEVLEQRERERMHPGDPLDLVGIDEGNPGFRDRTPTLARNVGVAVEVDLDELREQRLAMYTSGHVARRPVRALAPGGSERERGAAPAVPSAPPATPAKPWFRSTWVFVAGAVAAVAVAVLRRRV